MPTRFVKQARSSRQGLTPSKATPSAYDQFDTGRGGAADESSHALGTLACCERGARRLRWRFAE